MRTVVPPGQAALRLRYARHAGGRLAVPCVRHVNTGRHRSCVALSDQLSGTSAKGSSRCSSASDSMSGQCHQWRAAEGRGCGPTHKNVSRTFTGEQSRNKRGFFLSQNYYGLSWSGLRAAFTHFSRGFALITQAKGEVSSPAPSSDSQPRLAYDSLNLKPTLLRLILKSLKLKAASELNRS